MVAVGGVAVGVGVEVVVGVVVVGEVVVVAVGVGVKVVVGVGIEVILSDTKMKLTRDWSRDGLHLSANIEEQLRKRELAETKEAVTHRRETDDPPTWLSIVCMVLIIICMVAMYATAP